MSVRGGLEGSSYNKILLKPILLNLFGFYIPILKECFVGIL